MGITKNHIHTSEQIELANLFRALGHPARISIVENLLKHKTLTSKGLRAYIPLAQSTISEHLRVLQDAGILAVSVEDNRAFFFVQKIVLEQVVNFSNHLIFQIDSEYQKKLKLFIKKNPFIFMSNLLNQT